jgi:hypothetical protein
VALNKTFSVNSIHFGANAPLFVIAGPCVIESESHVAHGGKSGRHRLRNARPIHFQGVLRQSKPHLALFVSRPRPEKGLGHPKEHQEKDRPSAAFIRASVENRHQRQGVANAEFRAINPAD